MAYEPAPIDTSDFSLSDSLIRLAEKLAENTHDVWGKQRMEEGWTYGPARNDTLKQTPCLLDYGDLPGNEKVYDRNMAMETLKAILKLGFQIISPEKSAPDPENLEYQILRKKLQPGKTLDLKEFASLWQQRDLGLWQQYPDLYLFFGEIVLKAGEPLLAYDVLSHGLTVLGEVVWLSQLSTDRKELYCSLSRLQALALVQSGAFAEAHKLLQRLIAQGVTDPETRGVLGRTYKDMALTGDSNDTGYFQAAHEVYLAAFQDAKQQNNDHAAYYNGINAATMALLAGEMSMADKLALEVQETCHRVDDDLREKAVLPSFWLDATQGEAALLLGQFADARKYYAKAAAKTSGDIRSLGSMQKQAGLICTAIGESLEYLQDVFKTPTVIVFSGHMIDLPSRRQARFPIELEEEIRVKIRNKIHDNNGLIGYASAACGSDILFLEEMIELGGEINIVLPVDVADFKAQSVAPAGDGWLHRFDQLLARAASIKVLDHYNPASFPNSLEFCNLYLTGLARSRAEQIGTELRPLAVFDADSSGVEPGGTAGMISLWRRQQVEFSHIPLAAETIPDAQQNSSLVDVPLDIPGYDRVQHYLFLPMLFADVKGYSGLSEEQIVCFSTSCLGKIGRVVQRFQAQIRSKRTMGDGLFFVFLNLKAAIDLARQMQDMMNSEDWTKYNLPADLKMRISLDAGPSYSYIDPVMDQTEYCGHYVVRAARMEPVTPPGHIYASDTFVALCQALGVRDVRFDYAGQVALPKGYGTIQAYHVR